MGIQKDAEEVLVYCYKRKIAGESIPQQEELMEITGWDKKRVIFAMEYLIRKGLVMGMAEGACGVQGTVFAYINDISPDGIDVIENVDKFKRHFNHEVDLRIYKFSWGASEK